MTVVFLSASIPDERRDREYAASADLVAIRDAVRALASITIECGTLVWGGHPAITPLVRVVAESLGQTDSTRVVLYQSRYFVRRPKDNKAFEKVVLVPKVRKSREDSLSSMRRQMLSDHVFDAGIFIGGMKGVEDEYSLFKEMHPEAKAFPIASTGAAALAIYRRTPSLFPERLQTDLAYPSLFREILNLPATH